MHNHFDQLLNVKALILSSKPKLVVECGAFDGKNTRQLLELQKELPFRLVTISDHDHRPEVQQFPDPLPPDFEWRKGLSYRELENFEDGSVDFCSIDTDHNYWTMKQELSVLHRKLPFGGIVVMHDTQTYRKNSGQAGMYGTGDPYPNEIGEHEKNGKGMGDAIWEMLQAHQCYIVLRQVAESHGAMAIQKVNA